MPPWSHLREASLDRRPKPFLLYFIGIRAHSPRKKIYPRYRVERTTGLTEDMVFVPTIQLTQQRNDLMQLLLHGRGLGRPVRLAVRPQES